MLTLIALVYDSEIIAEHARLNFLKMEKESLFFIEDAVVAVHSKRGRVVLHQMYNLAFKWAGVGSFWGGLLGLFFSEPLIGCFVGFCIGLILWTIVDVGIDSSLVKQFTRGLQHGKSVLFILGYSDFVERVLFSCQGISGEVLASYLPGEEKGNFIQT